MRLRILIFALLLASAVGLGLRPAYAHGFGERYDLPVPLDYFLVGAAATVALSFVVIGIFVRRRSGTFSYPTYNLLGPRWFAAMLANRVLLTAIKLVFLALFTLVIATGLFGTDSPVDNLTPTLVWIIWWVGMGYISALLGNVWMLINPWKAAFELAEKLMGGESRSRDTGMFRYPEWLDVWPAVALFLVFAWLENVYRSAGDPFNLGVLVIAYSVITWAGMLAFGKHQWLRRGEAFSVLFGFFARFTPTEVRVTDDRVCGTCGQECNLSDEGCVDCYECFERTEASRRQLNLRPYAVGLAHPGRLSTATAVFVVLALATVTFDGLKETPLWVDAQTTLYDAASIFGSYNLSAIDTAGVVVVPAIFLAVYLAFSWFIREFSADRISVSDVARVFVFSLVPIALAYNLAHFVSLLLREGQQIIPLASDPFGFGWDILGTVDYRINFGIVNAKMVWFISVAAIVTGHIISVYLAHIIALRRMSSHASALRSQYPMLVLMVSYTATSLWIIAQPIVE